MREHALLIDWQSDCQRPRETGQGEHDVSLGQVTAEWPLAHGAADERFHERCRTSSEVWPFRLFQKGVENVHHPDPVIEGDVHVLAERIDAVRNGFDQHFSGADALIEHVTHGGMEQGLLIREMPVEGTDADAGAHGDRVSHRLAANLQHQLDHRFDEPLPVSLRISPHPAPAAPLPAIPLTRP